jgi:hypothetical protein
MQQSATAIAILVALLPSAVSAQDRSTWWHGRFVPADGIAACDTSDALVVYEAEAVIPWETYCETTEQVDIRDMQGVQLDISCSYPDAPDEGYNDRVALFELSNGNILEYSRLRKVSTELRRCP